MRLVNTRTLAIHEFVGRPPPYAILSHTWGEREVTLQDFHKLRSRERLHGFAKIRDACKLAQKQGLGYAWIDTCCIDKTSSAELSEAINSMFKWYRDAEICYAYLEDIDHQLDGVKRRGASKASGGTTTTQGPLGFGHSRWFSRGWTLQELIAPTNVEFYDRNWNRIGDKATMRDALAKATGIDAFILDGTADLEQVSVGRRMSWAVGRETKRDEDMAYSLLGIFNANIPLIYGEGATRAFVRLQEKILQQTDDHTIFAWRADPSDGNDSEARGLFATSPNDFRNFQSVSRRLSGSNISSVGPATPPWSFPVDNLARIWGSGMPQDPITKTNKGIHITSKIKDLRQPWAPRDLIILLLNCCFNGDPKAAAGIYLKRQGESHYVRIRASEIATVHPESTHIVASVYGLGSVTDIHHHHYDQPWTTSSRILGELSENRGSGTQAMQVREEYRDAVHIPRRSFRLYGLLGSFFLDRIWTVDARGLWRAFLFNPKDHAGDLVLKTHEKFKTALVFTSRTRKENIFIFVGTHTATPDGSTAHILNAICLTGSQAASLHGRFIRKGFGTSQVRTAMKVPSGDGASRRRIVPVLGRTSKLRITTSPTKLYDIPMQRLTISWASLLADSARFSIKAPAIITYLGVVLLWVASIVYKSLSYDKSDHQKILEESGKRAPPHTPPFYPPLPGMT